LKHTKNQHTNLKTLLKMKIHAINKNPHGQPKKGSEQASGTDLRAMADTSIKAGEFARIPTGLHIALPQQFEAQIRPRSGLTSQGIVAMLGTIDADYRGERSVVLGNFSGDDYAVLAGDRIAQLVVARFVPLELNFVDALPPTARGNNGFGSTGVK
jgi:dUTP pyrophosphatase